MKIDSDLQRIFARDRPTFTGKICCDKENNLPNRVRTFGFIVKEDTFTPGGQLQFKKGDILKAASWKAPAKNRARGNVLVGNYPIQWTGPLYLS